MHLWSLSIEEQFYALWPLTLLLLLRTRHSLGWIITITLTSFALCVSGQLHSVANFYLPLSRIWELMVGALLAAYLSAPSSMHRIEPRWYSESFSVVGVLLLGASLFWMIDSKSVFPGWKAALPTVGTALVIAAGPQAFLNRYLLGSTPFVWIGHISYPLYLWHWPLLSFLKITEGTALSLSVKTIAIAIAITCATLTYHLVEKPLRHRRGYTVTGLLVAAIVLALLGLGFWQGVIQPRQSGEVFQKIAAAKADHPLQSATSKASVVNVQGHELYTIGRGPQTTLYIGDSNMAQYWLGVEKTVLSMEGKRRALLGGCWLPIPGLEMPTACRETNEFLFSLAQKDQTIDTVVIAAQWRSLWSYSYSENGRSYPLSHTETEGTRKAMTQLSIQIQKIIQHGKKVYLILNIPGGVEFDPHNLVTRSLKGFHLDPHMEGGISLEQHRYITNVESPVSPILRDVAQRSGAILLDPADFLCRNGWCSAVTEDGEPIYSDSDHLRGTFSYYHPEFIAQTLK